MTLAHSRAATDEHIVHSPAGSSSSAGRLLVASRPPSGAIQCRRSRAARRCTAASGAERPEHGRTICGMPAMRSTSSSAAATSAASCRALEHQDTDYQGGRDGEASASHCHHGAGGAVVVGRGGPPRCNGGSGVGGLLRLGAPGGGRDRESRRAGRRLGSRRATTAFRGVPDQTGRGCSSADGRSGDGRLRALRGSTQLSAAVRPAWRTPAPASRARRPPCAAHGQG